MANRWGGKMEAVKDFIFLGSKITADGDWSHEIKRRLLLGKKSYNGPRQHIKKQRHHLAHKGPYSQSYSFSGSHVWMWEFNHTEGWALNNWYSWTVVLEKALESPQTARRSNQSILKETDPEYSLEGLMLRLKLQYNVPLMQRADSLGKPWCWERLKAEGEGDDRGWDCWVASMTW